MKYFSVLCGVIFDVIKDEIACLYVDLHNWTLKFRRKPKIKTFDESDTYFEPYKNDNA